MIENCLFLYGLYGEKIKMKFPKICFVTYTANDLKELTVLNNMNKAELRRNVEILVIDDENFSPEEHLQRIGFRVVHKKDIDNINDVAEYTVILCDIRGVGKTFGSKREGAFVIKEIKEKYPSKQVIAYTASSYDPSYTKDMNHADMTIQKGMALDDWVDAIDEQIKKAVDPIYQWERLRMELLQNGLSTIFVARLEDKYVQAIKRKNFTTLEKLASSENQEVRGLICDFLASACVKFVSGRI